MAAGGGIFLFIRTGSPAQPAPATPSSSSVHTFQLSQHSQYHPALPSLPKGNANFPASPIPRGARLRAGATTEGRGGCQCLTWGVRWGQTEPSHL